LAQSLGIEATVRVRIDIDEGGCVVAAGVLATSASDMLDEAAVRRALDQEYIPAGTDGKASRFSAVLPVTFSLRMREGPAGNRAQPQP
jgi:TonB family protein